MNLTSMIELGNVNPVFLFVAALLLGSLHGLEPGHSKTMMAAYLIAVHGTIKQAILLGISAAFSHSIIVWVLAVLALTWGNELIGHELEPWLMLLSGIVIMCIAAWMLVQIEMSKDGHHHHSHDHNHDHSRSHDHDHHHDHSHTHHHEHDDHAHMDVHARAHAADIQRRLASGRTGTWQTILFGLSGGLIPCPAAITVFLLCLHLDKMALGITLVSAFSIGLAVTLVGIGVVTAYSLNIVAKRTDRFDKIIEAAPWVSASLIAIVGITIFISGMQHFNDVH